MTFITYCLRHWWQECYLDSHYGGLGKQSNDDRSWLSPLRSNPHGRTVRTLFSSLCIPSFLFLLFPIFLLTALCATPLLMSVLPRSPFTFATAGLMHTSRCVENFFSIFVFFLLSKFVFILFTLPCSLLTWKGNLRQNH